MALIQFSNLVNDIRGSSGGNVFSRNRSGAYVRNRTTPLNPQTTAQGAARGLFANLAQAWRNLTVEQRAQWSAAVDEYPYLNKLGQTRTYSGQQLFMVLNRNLQSVDTAQINAPSAPAGVGTVASMTLTAVASTGVITVTPVINDEDGDTEYSILASRPVSAGRNYIGRSALRSVDVSTEATLEAGQDIGTEYASIFGDITGQAGSKIFVRVFGVNTVTGQKSAPFTVSAIITA